MRRRTGSRRAAGAVAGILAILLLAVVAATVTSAAPERPEAQGQNRMAWADEAAERLVSLGLWDPSRVRLQATATRRELARLLAGVADLAGAPDLTDGLPAPPDIAPADPDGPAIARAVRSGWIAAPGGLFRPGEPVLSGVANRAFVDMLGLHRAREALSQLTTADGRRLRLPPGFADEILAREAGLRHNYPHPDDDLEVLRTDAIRQADLLGMGAAAVHVIERPELIEDLDLGFAEVVLPAMSQTQRAVVERALGQVGLPYVWGGDWPTRASPVGPQEHGGFDCSGLVWYAWRHQASFRGGRPVVDRSIADRQARFGRGRLVSKGALKPGDLVFFGEAGRLTRRGGISHVGLALGNGYMVHSAASRAGTSISRLDRFWVEGYAVARRPLG